MKRVSVWMLIAGLTVGLWAAQASAQAYGSIKGACKDMEGKPIAGAVVELSSAETGHKYSIKTNDKGEYFSLGITPGVYKVTLTKDGKQLDSVTGFRMDTGEGTLDFDLKKSREQAAQQQGVSPEQLKKMQEQQEKQAKEVSTVKQLNEKLAAATASSQAGDFDAAVATLTEATQMDPSRDLLWFKLGDANRGSANKVTDPAEKTKRINDSVTDYEKAIDLKKKSMQSGTPTPEANKQLAAYYNNLGDSYGRAGKTDEAMRTYDEAAKLDPPGAGQYYFNLGAVLTNANKSNDPEQRKTAVAAFDKAIAIDPNRADAYYWKASNLIGLATLKDDKMVAPDGTAEAFQKYLELQPTGPHAEEAKAMLEGIGAQVTTSYGKKKAAKK